VSAPRLIEVELFVSDLERAVALYRDIIGVSLDAHTHGEGEPVHHHASWGDWDSHADGFLLLSLYAAEAGQVTRSSFGFAIDRLDAIHQRLEAAGIKVVQPPTSRPWGRSATYQDADGNTVSLTEG